MSLSSSEPCASRVLMAPFERPGNMRNVQLAAAIKSACTIERASKKVSQKGELWPHSAAGEG